MMAMQKISSPRRLSRLLRRQRQDNPVQIAADAAEGAMARV